MSKKASKRFFRVEIDGTGYYLAGQVTGGGGTMLTREETSANGTEVYDVDTGVKQIKPVTITFMDKPEERDGNQDFDRVKEVMFAWFESGERKNMQVVEFDDVKYTKKLGYSEYTGALCADFSAPEFDRTSSDARSFVVEIKPKKYKAVTSTGGTTKNPNIGAQA